MKKGLYASAMVGAIALLALVLCYPVLDAQAQGGPAGPDVQGGQGGQGGNRQGQRFDPAQMQTRMLENLKTQLNPTDDEWTVMEPRLKPVFELQMKQRMSQMGGMFGRQGRRGGQGMPGMGQPDPEVEALAQVLDKTDATSDEIKAKLDALRDARKKQAEELEKARASLREVLTLKQEAQLVLMGILD